MAKLLKHLGIGGKKIPPQPPKPDYNADNFEEKDQHTCHDVDCSGSTSCYDAEGRLGPENEEPDGSPHRKMCVQPVAPERTSSSKSKDSSADSASARSLTDRNTGSNVCSDDHIEGMEVEIDESGEEGDSNNLPLVLEDYSDPFDIQQLAAEKASSPEDEDEDYTEPYEAAKLVREMTLKAQQDGGEDDKPALYDDPYDSTSNGLSPVNHDTVPTNPALSSNSVDMRPQEDYDDPWELSAKKKQMLLQGQLSESANQKKASGNSPASQKKSMAKRTNQSAGSYLSSKSDKLYPSHSKYDPRTHLIAVEIGDEFTNLQEEFDTVSGDSSQSRLLFENNDQGNYEDPWDLQSKQEELENKIKAAKEKASRDGRPKVKSNSSKSPPTHPEVDGVKQNVPVSQHLDRRIPQLQHVDGRVPPLNHNDGPISAGYPNTDTRPECEYESPWENRMQEIQRDLYRAKYAKDQQQQQQQTRLNQEDLIVQQQQQIQLQQHQIQQQLQQLQQTQQKLQQHLEQVPQADTRPQDEYEDPWDSKIRAKKLSQLYAGTSSDSSPKSSSQSSHCQSGPLPATPSSQSPKKKSKLQLDLGCKAWNALGERVDPAIPLEQQGWYHGSISRVDAETLLRVHKEGSYLVRNSESSKQDFSLSLKSARGFMHMKIVNRDNKFILGQFSQPFCGIPQMIHHYSINKLPIKGAEHMSLLHPIINELL